MGKPPERGRVLVRRVSDFEQGPDSRNLEAAVNEALDFLGFSFTGKRIWVKPNLLAPHPPERSVTTEPSLVRLVVRGLRSRGAAAVWVADNPAGGLQRDIAGYLTPTGVPQACEGCFCSTTERPAILRLKSRFVETVPVSQFATRADVILNLPVFKTHALTIITGAVKNLFGVIPGAQKSHLHTKARSAQEFAELLVDIWEALPLPVLTIMDALRGMDGPNGPSSGRVLSIRRLIAGANPAAVDTIQAAMAGCDPLNVPTIRTAAERRLGPGRLSEIEITGDYQVIPGFRLPPARFASGLTPLLARTLYPFLRRWPVPDRQACTQCLRCAENCPTQAISVSKYPEIDRARCIICYCCAEICPNRALRIPRWHEAIRQHLTGR